MIFDMILDSLNQLDEVQLMRLKNILDEKINHGMDSIDVRNQMRLFEDLVTKRFTLKGRRKK